MSPRPVVPLLPAFVCCQSCGIERSNTVDVCPVCKATVILIDPPPLPPIAFTLVLEPVLDPLTKLGYDEREPTYRLKLAVKELLRKYGFVAKSILPSTEKEKQQYLDWLW